MNNGLRHYEEAIRQKLRERIGQASDKIYLDFPYIGDDDASPYLVGLVVFHYANTSCHNIIDVYIEMYEADIADYCTSTIIDYLCMYAVARMEGNKCE